MHDRELGWHACWVQWDPKGVAILLELSPWHAGRGEARAVAPTGLMSSLEPTSGTRARQPGPSSSPSPIRAWLTPSACSSPVPNR